MISGAMDGGGVSSAITHYLVDAIMPSLSQSICRHLEAKMEKTDFFDKVRDHIANGLGEHLIGGDDAEEKAKRAANREALFSPLNESMKPILEKYRPVSEDNNNEKKYSKEVVEGGKSQSAGKLLSQFKDADKSLTKSLRVITRYNPNQSNTVSLMTAVENIKLQTNRLIHICTNGNNRNPLTSPLIEIIQNLSQLILPTHAQLVKDQEYIVRVLKRAQTIRENIQKQIWPLKLQMITAKETIEEYSHECQMSAGRSNKVRERPTKLIDATQSAIVIQLHLLNECQKSNMELRDLLLAEKTNMVEALETNVCIIDDAVEEYDRFEDSLDLTPPRPSATIDTISNRFRQFEMQILHAETQTNALLGAITAVMACKQRYLSKGILNYGATSSSSSVPPPEKALSYLSHIIDNETMVADNAPQWKKHVTNAVSTIIEVIKKRADTTTESTKSIPTQQKTPNVVVHHRHPAPSNKYQFTKRRPRNNPVYTRRILYR